MTDTAFVTLRSIDPPLEVRTLLGDGVPGLSGGTGGWSEITRPRRVSLTDWDGQSPLRLQLDLMLDGWSTKESVQASVDALRRMARVLPGDVRTPLVQAFGDGLPAEALEVDEWVVEDLTLGAMLRDDTTGELLRQAAQVSLLQFVDPDVSIVKRTRPVPTGPGTYRLYRVRRGDTLPKIAVALLRNHTRWRQIAQLNGLRSPTIPRRLIGKLIKVPRR